MSVRERFSRVLNKIFFYFFIFFWLGLQNTLANNKELIIDKLNKINTIHFNFNQTTNNETETGSCVLAFPGKLNCNYLDDKKKEIIINKKSLVVKQNRYGKIYFYPISKSPFLRILHKPDLIKIIKNSTLSNDNKIIFINHTDKNNNKIVIFFDKNKYNLLGWEVTDQFKNIINFSIKITALNQEIDSKNFKIPALN
jgi:outer membrane lipoprotein-sorting protein